MDGSKIPFLSLLIEKKCWKDVRIYPAFSKSITVESYFGSLVQIAYTPRIAALIVNPHRIELHKFVDKDNLS